MNLLKAASAQTTTPMSPYQENKMMSTQEQLVSSTPEITATRFVRRDFLSAHIVEVGLLLQEQFGVEHAAAFLKDNFIHLDVAMRVLLRPAERRRHNA